MKAIITSIKPKTCANIMNLIQSILVIKNKKEATAIQKLIDEYGYADIYAYCTKDKEQLTSGYSSDIKGTKYFIYNDNEAIDYRGKVIFKFRCYKVEEVKFIMDYSYGGYYNTNSYVNEKCFERDCCLTFKELDNYINKNNLYKRDNVAYALHISNLEIFDKPKELSEFRHWVSDKKCKKCPFEKYYGCNPCLEIEALTNAPQNFYYVEVDKSYKS